MHRATRSVIALIALAAGAALTGCQAPLAIEPGLSGLRVEVRARPKGGVRADIAAGGAYSDDAQSIVRPGFERINYAQLGDIVVWAEPESTPTGEAPALTLKLGDREPVAAPPTPSVAAVGALLVIRNTSSAPLDVYSVSPGNVFDLGEIGVGGEKSATLAHAGLVELLDPRVETPLARIYVAPSRWVAVARANQTISFANLPPGACRVGCWHPRLPAAGASVELRPDQVATARVVVGVDALSARR